ncbi:MAG TPA: glycosyltransferase family 39 protein [Thermoanaerobaculia bacterium]|nr:glycosyltransferase family 39 protein [Thermoanaerobaculia bacterium]
MRLLRPLPWIAVLLLAAALRAPSLTAAQPYMSYVDEGNYLHVSARMIRDGRWIPDEFLYPSLPITAVAAAARAYDPIYRARHEGRPMRDDVLTGHDGYYDVLEPFEILLLGRILSFLAGLGVVLVTGLLARRVAGPRAGLLAAFTAALLPALVARGGIAVVDPYATFFVAACLLFTERARTSDRPGREALLAGAMAGFAFASKYPAILISLSFALTVWLSRPAWRERLRLWAIAAAGAIGAAVLAMPGLLTVPGQVLGGILRQSELYKELTSPPLWPQVVTQAEWDIPMRGPEVGWIFLALVAMGLGAALWDRRTRPSATGWALFVVLGLALYTRQSFTPFRNFLPLLPIGCVAVAVLFERLRIIRFSWAHAAGFVLIAILFGPQVVRFARERAGFEDSRVQAIDWVARNSRPGQTVLVLNDLAFLPSEIGRLAGRRVEVQAWDQLQQRIPGRRARYLVITQMNTQEGRPLISAEWIGKIQERYKERALFGEHPASPFPGHWHGNRQVIRVLERRRAPRADGAGQRSSAPRPDRESPAAPPP